MKRSKKIVSFSKYIFPVNGSVALKPSPAKKEVVTEKPLVRKLVISKSKPRIFAGCYQMANGQDFC